LIDPLIKFRPVKPKRFPNIFIFLAMISAQAISLNQLFINLFLLLLSLKSFWCTVNFLTFIPVGTTINLTVK